MSKKGKVLIFPNSSIKLAQKICFEYYPKYRRVRLKEGMENFSLKNLFLGVEEGTGGWGPWEGVSSTTENTFWLFTHSCLSDAPNASCHKYSVLEHNKLRTSHRNHIPAPKCHPLTPYNPSPDSLGLSHPPSGHQGLPNIRTFRGFNLSGVKTSLENPVKGSMPRVCTCISYTT